MYNILIGGAAGDGIETTAAVLQKTLKQMGYHVFVIRDFMSRVRGGHNFVQIRFSTNPIHTHGTELDGIVALNEESYRLHESRLHDNGFVLCEPNLDFPHTNLVHLPMTQLATDAGNPRAAGSVVIGAVLALFDLDLKKAEEVFQGHFPEKILEANLKSIQAGYDYVSPLYQPETPVDLSDYAAVSGTQAMALGAIAGGMGFYTAYPMSPSTGLLTYFTQVGVESQLVVEQAEDEIAAVNMAIGASAGGVRAMTGTSGGGFSLMVEGLGFSGIGEIPLVIADVQRPGPATGLPTRTEQADLRFVISASQGEFPRMVIAPQDHLSLYHQTKRAFDLAEKYQIPVILLSDQYLADSTSVLPLSAFDDDSTYTVLPLSQQEKPVADENNVYKRYQYTETGISPLLYPGQTDYLVKIDSDEHTEYGRITESAEVRVNMVNKRARKLELLKEELVEPLFHGVEHPEVLVVGFGSTYHALKEAIGFLNSEEPIYGMLSFGDVYPLPETLLRSYGESAQQILSVEQNSTGQLAGLIRETTLIHCQPAVLKYDGRQLTVEEIVDGLKSYRKDGK